MLNWTSLLLVPLLLPSEVSCLYAFTHLLDSSKWFYLLCYIWSFTPYSFYSLACICPFDPDIVEKDFVSLCTIQTQSLVCHPQFADRGPESKVSVRTQWHYVINCHKVKWIVFGSILTSSHTYTWPVLPFCACTRKTCACFILDPVSHQLADRLSKAKFYQ